MNVRLAPALAVLGLLVTIFGAVMGLTPIHRAGVSCGSVFRPDDNAASVRDLTNAIEADAGLNSDYQMNAVSDACAAAVSDRKPIALGALIPGTLVLLIGVGFAAREHWTAQEARESDTVSAAPE